MSSALLRFLILPSFKISNKLFNSHPDHGSKILMKLSTSPRKFIPSHPDPMETRATCLAYGQGGAKLPTEETTEEGEQEITEIKKSGELGSPLRKNMLDHRVKSLQYDANKPSEDSLAFDQLRAIDAYTVSIFDGHGGAELAQYSKSKISSLIDAYLVEHMGGEGVRPIEQLLRESLVWSYQKLEDSFFEIYEQQLKMGNKRIKNVGTCGITAIVYNDRVFVGNSGDSQALFIRKEGGMFETQEGNERLSVNNREERRRIREKWSGVDENIIAEESSNCFYLKGRLQPTRTLGDYYLKKKEYYNGDDVFRGPYLSCQPDVIEHRLTQAHKYLVIASDGLWDVLDHEQVMQSLLMEQEIDLTKTCYDMEENEEGPCLESLLHSVLDRACQNSGKSMEELKGLEKGVRRNYHDDITIAVINLQNQV